MNAELLPMASATFEPGPPNENSIELARVVDRGLRESEALALEGMCLISGEQVIVVFTDIYVLDYDGNLIDASAIASLAALLTATHYKYTVKRREKIEVKDDLVPLTVENHPIAITAAKIGKTVILDPSLEEEQVLDARLTLTVDKDDKICAVQKSGLGTFSPSEIREAIGNAVSKSQEIRSTVLEAVKSG